MDQEVGRGPGDRCQGGQQGRAGLLLYEPRSVACAVQRGGDPAGSEHTVDPVYEVGGQRLPSDLRVDESSDVVPEPLCFAHKHAQVREGEWDGGLRADEEVRGAEPRDQVVGAPQLIGPLTPGPLLSVEEVERPVSGLQEVGAVVGLHNRIKK